MAIINYEFKARTSKLDELQKKNIANQKFIGDTIKPIHILMLQKQD